MYNELFELIHDKKGYSLFKELSEKTFPEYKFKVEKEFAIMVDNTLADLMNIINNAGWDSKENHSKVMDIIRKQKNVFDKYLEDQS